MSGDRKHAGGFKAPLYSACFFLLSFYLLNSIFVLDVQFFGLHLRSSS